MASYLNKAEISTAITDNTKLDLGHSHITTADFMQLNVSWIHEMVPGEKIDVNMESLARLNPLPVPTYGRARLNNRAFFVPFRTIFRGWNDFITDTIHIASNNDSNPDMPATVPYISNQDLLDIFLNKVTQSTNDLTNRSYYLYQPGSGANVPYDVDYINASGVSIGKYQFTVQGRQIIKVLESLGYKLYWEEDYTAEYSALPILALGKIFCDWYWPNQYNSLYGYDNIMRVLNRDMYTNGSGYAVTTADADCILLYAAYVFYDSDYFTSAWDSPNQPRKDLHSDFTLTNLDTIDKEFYRFGNNQYTVDGIPRGKVTNNSGTTVSSINTIAGATAPFIAPIVTGNLTSTNQPTAAFTPISEYMLDSLHRLTDFLKRNQIAGGRAMDRYFARYGMALKAEQLNRSVYLGNSTQDIQIGDIMSTSDTVNNSTGTTTGSQLGAYAGKGISYGKGHFECQTDEFGYFIILTSILPSGGYYQGVDRQNMRLAKLEFFTPEFDALGAQPITSAEVIIPQYPVSTYTTNGTFNEHIYGYAPRYADYKCTHDSITGNFRLPSINGYSVNSTTDFNAASSWHLMRDFDMNFFNNDVANITHNPLMLDGKYDALQYKRIFYNNLSTAPDNFTIIHNFEVAAYAPMKSMYDCYEFEQEGKKVKMDIGGVKLN